MTKNTPPSHSPIILNQGDSELVDIDTVQPHERNVNEGDFGKIEESIKEHGFWGSVVCQQSTRKILCGNHRWLVAKHLGYKSIPVTWIDCSPETALRILLSDNATARAGNDNPNALAELLAELAGTDKGLSGTGFDGDDLQSLIDGLAGPMFDPVGIDEQGRLDEKAKVTCPECKHEFSPN